MTNLDETFDTTFQSTSKKLVLTPKTRPIDHVNHDGDISDFSTEELVRLLALMEGELEAKEDLIDHLKKERTKLLLAEAKYGKLNMNDPFAALRRDSAITNEQIDEDQISTMYESQVDQLEKLIAAHKKSQKNATTLLTSLDKKHWKLVKKLEADRNAKIKYAKQGDDLVALLEKERSSLNQQIEFHIEEKQKVQVEKDKLEVKMAAEKKKHEAIVLYLIQERKQMLLKMHELRVNTEQLLQQQQQQQQQLQQNKPGTSLSISDRELIEELKKEVTFLRSERESLTKTQKMMKAENLSLKETIRGQETDLMMLRKNVLSGGSKVNNEKISTMLPQLTSDGSGLIVANRGATTASQIRATSTTITSPSSTPPTSSIIQNSTRLSTSSSFPVEKSRLPRGPVTSSATVPRTSIGGVGPAHLGSGSRTMSSPIKKTPVMGLSSTTRRPQSSSASIAQSQSVGQLSSSSSTTTTTMTNNPIISSPIQLTPELEQLEAAIQSMNVSSGEGRGEIRISNNINKRSTSLPREQNNNPKIIKNGGFRSIKNGTTGVVTTRIATPSASLVSERKLSGTVKRNGIFTKAFGSSK